MEGKYGLKNMEKIMEAFTVVVNEHPFNPVADYLESLIWDQKPHIDVYKRQTQVAACPGAWT